MGKSDHHFISRLDNFHYNEKDLIEIKIPIPLPYLQNQPEYERVDGTVEFNGVHYNYVKRKIDKDTLFILCIFNESKTKLDNARLDYGKQVNDFPNQKSTNTVIKKAGFSSDYNHHFDRYTFVNPLRIISTTSYYYIDALIDNYSKETFHPPQHQC